MTPAVADDLVSTTYGCDRGVEIRAWYFGAGDRRHAILDLPQGVTLFELRAEMGDGAEWVEPGGLAAGLIWRTKGWDAHLAHVAFRDWRTGEVEPERVVIDGCGELG
ncbi:MAG: hypothetical protein KF887_13315 [Paracoccaceae bacterium]|nr:MAG: hypothetical protein KF887_13315 [Paracoccaceae bacterium]